MPVYPPEIAEAIRKPRYCRPIPEANATGSEAKFDCGCFIRVEMRIEGDRATIREIGYRTNGCGYMVAAAEAMCESLSSRSLLDLHGEIVIESVGRYECSQAAVSATRRALADHRWRRLEEFRGEKALICTCFGISEEMIEDFVRSRHPVGVGEVSEAIRAGSGCGSCRMLIQEIIDANG